MRLVLKSRASEAALADTPSRRLTPEAEAILHRLLTGRGASGGPGVLKCPTPAPVQPSAFDRLRSWFAGVMGHRDLVRAELLKAVRPFVGDIEQLTRDNTDFRRVLYTGREQLVVMALKPGEEIGAETHPETDQFLRIEAGAARVELNGQARTVKAGEAIVVPAGTRHNVINASAAPLRLYTIYSRPEHPPNAVEHTKPSPTRAAVPAARPANAAPPAHQLATLHTGGPETPGHTIRLRRHPDQPGRWILHTGDRAKAKTARG
jgi:mannose-6-phosphate isomerase-like protein (cupin superfamily)